MTGSNRDNISGRFIISRQARALIWSHLVVYPGLTASEVARALRLSRGATKDLCERMSTDGQLTSKKEYRSQQGRDVDVWYAVPGALTIEDEPA